MLSGVLAGWTTTETGRQPWVVYGHLRTADAMAPVTAHAVTLSLTGFFAIYAVIMLAFLWFAARIVLAGPGGRNTIATKCIRPGMARNAPTLIEATPPGRSPLSTASPATKRVIP